MGRPPAYDHGALLRELIDCLWERGYAATPISVLVERTGVNAASLYARFGSKKGIMLAALELYGQETLEGLERLLASTRPGAAQVRAVLEHATESFDDPRARGCFLVNSVTNVSADTPDFGDAVAAYMREIRDRLRDALREAPGLRPGLTPEEGAVFVQNQVWGLKVMARMRPERSMGEIVIRQTLHALFTEEALAGENLEKP